MLCRYALTGKEVVSILMQRLVKVDGKVRTDCTYPAGFMDVIEIDRTDEHFRLIYDTKGRFVTHRITKGGLSAGASLHSGLSHCLHVLAACSSLRSHHRIIRYMAAIDCLHRCGLTGSQGRLAVDHLHYPHV